MSTRTSQDVHRQAEKITSKPQTAFIAKAEDGVYKAAGIVKEEAKAVQHIAQLVESLSATIEEDVDNVETFVHQVTTTTKSIEEDLDEASIIPNGSHLPSSKATEVDILALGWPWSVFHVFLIFLTLFVVLLHNWGSSSTLAQNDMGLGNSSIFTSFSMLLINMGTILRVIKFIRDAMSWQKQNFIKVEEDVHEIGQEVKSMVKRVEGVAEMVANISQQIEGEADEIQCSIAKVLFEETWLHLMNIVVRLSEECCVEDMKFIVGMMFGTMPLSLSL